jgi:hypothetical protein
MINSRWSLKTNSVQRPTTIIWGHFITARRWKQDPELPRLVVTVLPGTTGSAYFAEMYVNKHWSDVHEWQANKIFSSFLHLLLAIMDESVQNLERHLYST